MNFVEQSVVRAILAVIAVLGGLSAPVVLADPASANEVFAGSCVVTLVADRVGSTINLTTWRPGTNVCAGVDGTSTGMGTVRLTGTAGANDPAPGFTCAGGLGIGSAVLEVMMTDGDVVAREMLLTVAVAGEAVTMSMIEDTGSQHVSAVGSFDQVPGVTSTCTTGWNPTHWTGAITFENPRITGKYPAMAGSCVLTLEADRVGSTINLSTWAPGINTCAGLDTFGTGMGTVALTATVGADDPVPGFTCAGGLGIGSGVLDITMTDGRALAEQMLTTVAHGGGPVAMNMAEDTANAHLVAVGAFNQVPDATATCTTGVNPTHWTGVISFEHLIFGG